MNFHESNFFVSEKYESSFQPTSCYGFFWSCLFLPRLNGKIGLEKCFVFILMDVSIDAVAVITKRWILMRIRYVSLSLTATIFILEQNLWTLIRKRIWKSYGCISIFFIFHMVLFPHILYPFRF